MANINISQIRMKRGNTAASSTYIGPLGELLIDTGLQTIRIQDGATPGGWIVAANGSSGSGNVDSTVTDAINANVTAANVQITALWANAATQTVSIASLTSNAAAQQTSIDTLLANAAAQASSITTLTANAATQLSQINGANAAIVAANNAVVSYVDNQITTLIGGAPTVLNTLYEISSSLGNNASLSTTLLNSIAGANAAIVTANLALKSYVDSQISTITLSEIDGNATITNQVTSVSTIRFDRDTGFNVEDLGAGEVKVSLGSSWKTWQVDGQDSLVAVGEDTVTFVAGNNMIISTDANAKTITFNSNIGEIDAQPVMVGSSAEGSEGALWYNTDEGRLYVNYSNEGTLTWVDANPSAVPGNMVAYESSGNVELRDDANLVFPDSTVQSTAFDTHVGNTAPAAGLIWYNTEDGRTYNRVNGVWVDANPTVLPGNIVTYNTDGNITLGEGGQVTWANGRSILSGVAGSDTGDVTFIGRTIIGTPNQDFGGFGQLNFAPSLADYRDEKWARLRTGIAEDESHIHFDTSDNGTYDLFLGDDWRYVKNAADGNIYIHTDSGNWMFDHVGTLTTDGSIFVNGEGRGLIVDAGGDKRFGFMKYYGIEGALTHNSSVPIRIGRTVETDITQASASSFTTEIYVATDGKVGIANVAPAHRLTVGGDIYTAGNIVFADGTVQTTAGGASYGNTQVAAYLSVYPQAGTYSDSNVAEYLVANPQASTYSNSNVASYLPTYSGNIAGNIAKNGHTWTFSEDGTTTFPSNTIKTAGSLAIQTLSSTPSSVADWNGGGGWNQGSYTDLATTGGTGTGLTVDVAADGSGYINIESITINTPGSGYTDGDVITIENENNLTGTFTIGVTANNWTLDATGDLTFPDSTVQTTAWTGILPNPTFVGSDEIGFAPPAPLNLNNSAEATLLTQLNLLNTGGGAGAGSAIDFWTYASINDVPEVRLQAVDDGDYSADFAIKLKATGNEGQGSLTTSWTFGSDGSTTFPDRGAVTITGNLTVGNLIVNGNTTTINTESYTVVDNIIQMASGNPADSLDLGFVAHRTVGSTLEHTGLVRSASIGKWSLFSNVVPQPGGTVDLTNAVLDDLLVGTVQGTDFKFANGVSILSTVDVYSDSNVAAYLEGSITTGNILPAANVTYNLGSPTQQWNSLYVSSDTIYLGGVPLSVSDGTLLVGSSPITANTGTVSFSYNRIKGNPANATGTIFTKNTDRQNLYASGSGTTNGISFDEIGEISSVAVGWIMTWADGRTVEITNVVDWGSFRTFQFEQQSYNAGEVFPMTIQSPDYFAGSDSIVQITPNANVTSSTWSFYGNGNVVFPDGTTQTTAYTGASSTYSNTDVASYLPTYSGNISAANIVTTGATSGNISGANYISANAFQVSTGIFWANGTAWSSAGGGTIYSNTNVAAYLTTASITTTGNITAGNLIGTQYGNTIGTTAIYTGNVTAANIIASQYGNSIGTTATYSGNITAANIVTTGTYGNISGANVISANTVTVTTYVRTQAVTFAALPSAAAAGAGARAFITDGNTATFGSQVSGSGANAVPVYSNGTNWYVG